MSKKIYFKGRQLRKDGNSNFIYLIEENNGERPSREITIIVHARWYDEELMRIEKLDITQSRSVGVLLRYIALEAAEQYDKIISGASESTFREIPPDRAIDFDEITNLSKGDFPEVILPEHSPQS